MIPLSLGLVVMWMILVSLSGVGFILWGWRHGHLRDIIEQPYEEGESERRA